MHSSEFGGRQFCGAAVTTNDPACIDVAIDEATHLRIASVTTSKRRSVPGTGCQV